MKTNLLPLVYTGLALMLASASRPASATMSSDSTCNADFRVIEASIRADYAGFPTRVPANEEAFEALTRRVRAEARVAQDVTSCLRALQPWIAFFDDNHLQVWATAPGPSNGSTVDSSTASSERPDELSLRFPDDSTAVLRIPSFERSHKSSLDSLIAENRGRIVMAPYLIIDVRGNGGGWTDTYVNIIPLLYTDPIFVAGMDIYASPGNTAAVRQMVHSERVPEAMREQAREVLARMEASPGGFVLMFEDNEIRLDSVHALPRAVAVLIDRGCASTCEAFVLEARQSRKVSVLGTANTRGLLDFGNVRRIPLPSGQLQFQMAVSRSRRLPHNSLDRTGLAPHVRIPPEEVDPIGFALRYLRTRVQEAP